MSKKRLGPEQIIAKLREAEVGLSQGQTVGQVCRKLGVTDQTYYRCTFSSSLRCFRSLSCLISFSARSSYSLRFFFSCSRLRKVSSDCTTGFSSFTSLGFLRSMA